MHPHRTEPLFPTTDSANLPPPSTAEALTLYDIDYYQRPPAKCKSPSDFKRLVIAGYLSTGRALDATELAAFAGLPYSAVIRQSKTESGMCHEGIAWDHYGRRTVYRPSLRALRALIRGRGIE